VRNALGRAGLDPADVGIELDGVGGARGTAATISIAYPYDFAFLGPLIGWVGADRLATLRTSFSMRNE
jgi:hypothetical protein